MVRVFSLLIICLSFGSFADAQMAVTGTQSKQDSQSQKPSKKETTESKKPKADMDQFFKDLEADAKKGSQCEPKTEPVA